MSFKFCALTSSCISQWKMPIYQSLYQNIFKVSQNILLPIRRDKMPEKIQIDCHLKILEFYLYADCYLFIYFIYCALPGDKIRQQDSFLITYFTFLF